MKITNNYNLPLPLLQAVIHDPYSKGDADFSCTGLLKPPLMIRLERDYEDELVEDVADRIWSLFGRALHTILEDGSKYFLGKDHLVEQRFFLDVNGYKISGAIDHYDKRLKVITDYKVTSVDKLKFSPKEWGQQLNIQAYLLEKNGLKVKGVQNFLLLKDWKEKGKLKDSRYPEIPAAYIRHELLPVAEQGALVDELVARAANALEVDNPYELCECDTWRGLRCKKYCVVRNFCERACK